MKTLYISDLDGTLLQPSVTLSEKSVAILRPLLQQGISFSVATARTAASVKTILAPLPITAPVVLMNGVCVYDLTAQRYLRRVTLPMDTARQCLQVLAEQNVSAFLYRISEHALSCYYTDLNTAPLRSFYQERRDKYDKPFTQVGVLSDALTTDTVYLTTLGTYETLAPVYARVKNLPGISTAFYEDIYGEHLWYLELFGADASKETAVQFLRHYGNYDRIVGFGDNRNDMPLFRACDTRCAVANAKPELLACADVILGANTTDSVAEWILQQTKL